MNPSSPKNFQILKRVLHFPNFTAGLIAGETGITPGYVIKTFRWLEDNRFIERIKKTSRLKSPENPDAVRYKLTNPVGLLKAISFARSMKKHVIFESKVDMSKQEVLGSLNNGNTIFCLDSALEKYDSTFSTETVCGYIESKDAIREIRRCFPRDKNGTTIVKFYFWDFKLDLKDPMNSINGSTTELQTLIDLFCDGKSYYARGLLKKRWGV